MKDDTTPKRKIILRREESHVFPLSIYVVYVDYGRGPVRQEEAWTWLLDNHYALWEGFLTKKPRLFGISDSSDPTKVQQRLHDRAVWHIKHGYSNSNFVDESE